MHLIQKSPEVVYSVPFIYGCSAINTNERSVMVIGQEAYDFPRYDNSVSFSLKVQQDFTVRFLEKQAYGINNGEKYENSPFWDLFRLMTNEGLKPSWNNVDKVHRIIVSDNKSETSSLSVDDEMILDAPINSNGYTLLQIEINIVKPNTIVFATGPHYYKTMAASLGIDPDILYGMRPQKVMPIKNISSVVDNGINILWSYHPKYLRILGGNELFESLIEGIIKVY